MANDVETEQLIAALILHAADHVAAGMTRAQVIQVLVALAAKPDVAHAIALQGEAVYVARGGVLPR